MRPFSSIFPVSKGPDALQYLHKQMQSYILALPYKAVWILVLLPYKTNWLLPVLLLSIL